MDKDKKFSNQWRDYEKWRNSIERILYDLSVVGDVTIVDEEDKYLIAKTLRKLPKNVREKVLDEVTFIIAHGIYGTIFDLHSNFLIWEKLSKLVDENGLIKLDRIYDVDLKTTFILLNFSAMENEPESVKMSTIAHEIAHFTLGYHKVEQSRSKSHEELEKEADDLIVKWGFKPTCKSPSNTK